MATMKSQVSAADRDEMKRQALDDEKSKKPGAPNLYDANQLQQYRGRVKLLISCRSQRVQELGQEDCFMPHPGGKLEPRISTGTVS